MNFDQKQILVLLSEAHEEDLVVRINTVLAEVSSRERMLAFSGALRRLLGSGYCLMSSHRDPVPQRLLALPKRESLDRLARSIGSVSWDASQSLWIWRGPSDRPQVLLTERGVTKTDKILEEDGWIV